MAIASTRITRSFSARTSPAMRLASPSRLRAVVRPGRPQHHPPLFQCGVRDHPGAPVRIAVQDALRLGHVLRLVDDQRPGVVRPRSGYRQLACVEQRSQVLAMDRPGLQAKLLILR